MACGSGEKLRANANHLPSHSKLPQPMRFEYGTKGKLAMPKGSLAAILRALADRIIPWPLTVQAAMLPPSSGMRSQRSVPCDNVRMSVVDRLGFTCCASVGMIALPDEPRMLESRRLSR